MRSGRGVNRGVLGVFTGCVVVAPSSDLRSEAAGVVAML